MDSQIKQALDQARRSVVEEARLALEQLKDGATAEVDQAEARLNSLIDSWEKAAEKMNGLGLTSIAEIALNGGMVWVRDFRVNRGNNGFGLDTLIRYLGESNTMNSWPTIQVKDNQEFEAFIMIVPKNQDSNGHSH